MGAVNSFPQLLPLPFRFESDEDNLYGK
jgi:hypothetical protein